MKIKNLLAGAIILLGITISFSTPSIALALGGDKTTSPPPGYQPVKPTIVKTRALATVVPSKILLIESSLPWGSYADMTVLDNLGYTYDVADISQVSSKTLPQSLAKYQVVIIAGDQNQAFYDSYSKIESFFETYVKNGGVLVFFACDNGWAGGNLTAPLPGGVLKNDVNPSLPEFYEYWNWIYDDLHPIVTDILTESSPLTNDDLVGNYCSHGFFSIFGVAKNLDVIFVGSNSYMPTLIEYSVGKGTVIASTNTWERSYDVETSSGDNFFATKALDDIFKYAISIKLRPVISKISGKAWPYPNQSFSYSNSLYKNYIQIPYEGYPAIPVNVIGTALDKIVAVSINLNGYKTDVPIIGIRTKTLLHLDLRALTNGFSDSSPQPVANPEMIFWYENSAGDVLPMEETITPGIIPSFYANFQAWGQCTWYAGILMRRRNGQSEVKSYSQTVPINGNPDSTGFPTAGSVLNASGTHMAYLENISESKRSLNPDGSENITYALSGSQYNADGKCSGPTAFSTTLIVYKSKDGKQYKILKYPFVVHTVTKVKQ
jgi:hypothetical protein